MGVGGFLLMETKNDFIACCVEYGLVEKQGAQGTRQLFCFVLVHSLPRGRGPPEIEHKVAVSLLNWW